MKKFFEKCFSGQVFSKDPACECDACLMKEISRQVLQALPQEIRVELVKHGAEVTLDHPERPFGVCGLVWESQYIIAESA